MRLKTLEIKGFKSFADPTVINFEDDVIGIVGPNGSGKSNIVDAFRWVLGEQSSRELRLDQMSSVIFNGSKERKPSGVAQVTLQFENTSKILPTEYQSVAISRLLYRSGESEYRLNGVTCRLKDITNLFVDTGIGSDSYAIIALSMVDEILADKDNARRKMFEQAAGVSKYKLRKKETLSRLDTTMADLERVEDLLFEINNNLKTLEQQARRARRYFELKEEYKQLSIKLVALKSLTLKNQQKEIQSKLAFEEDTFRQTELDITKLEVALQGQKKTNLDQEIALSSRQKEVNELSGFVRDKENERKVLDQRVNFIEQSKTRSGEQLGSSNKQLEVLEKEIVEYTSILDQEKLVEKQLERQLAAAEKQLHTIRESHGAMKSGLDSILLGQQEIEKALFELEKQKAVNLNQIESSRSEINQIRQDIFKRTQDTQNLFNRTKEIEETEQDYQSKLHAIEQAEENLLAQILAKESELEAINSKTTRIHRELDSKHHEFKLTKSMVDNLEGFPESIRFLNTNVTWSRNAQLLSDIIYVEPEYRVPIENYLESFLSYYIVDNFNEARNAVSLLHSAQKGKANFFILDAFNDYTPEMVLLPPGSRPATETIQCDERYKKLIYFLLDKVIIAEGEDLHAPLVQDNFTVIARSGRFIQRRYSLSGGSIGLFEGKKIGRKKNLEILESEIAKLEKEENRFSSAMYQCQSELEKLKATSHKAEKSGLQNSLNQIRQDIVTLKARQESYELYVKEGGQKIERLEAKNVELMEANAAIEAALDAKMGNAELLRSEIASADINFRQTAEQLSLSSTEYNSCNIELIKQQNKVSNLQRELAYREKSKQETEIAIAGFLNTLNNSDNEIEEINDLLLRLQEELTETYERKKELESNLTYSEQMFFKARGDIHETENAIRALTKKSQDTQIIINTLKDKLSEVKFQLVSLAQRLSIEFNISLNNGELIAIDDTKHEKFDETEIELKVDKIKLRLENYGEINPMAVEAYDEIKKRHEVINSQREDILKAKNDLIETIREIEETATTQFLDAFSRVRLYFIDVFRKLFTSDDTADLVLLNPDNPLESAIEIIAKPKGKKPQTISQLSGGEKTLTATALLFALYLLKPAPFCIFDEVDAPLDDANILKFNNIIQEFSKQSQFIIVTHNKQTMAAVSSIYGIYMAEKGVSSVAQVNFTDLKHEAVLQNVES